MRLHTPDPVSRRGHDAASADPLLYDWNAAGPGFDWGSARVVVLDETLRDGLQSASACDPPVEAKRELLHLMAAVGVGAANVGLPASGRRALADAAALVREAADARLALRAVCAARTLAADVQAIAEVAGRAGAAPEAALFVGASPLRRLAEGRDVGALERLTAAAVAEARRLGLDDVMFVCEDATRTEPPVLARLFGAAVAAGASRVCVADTVGHATPDGARRLVAFAVRAAAEAAGADLPVDWHGHRDRGLGLACALAAVEAGAGRVHATALGMGERVGNVELELLIVNLQLLGAWRAPLARLGEYAACAARACGVPIAASHPAFGADAFRTAAGVHASAIGKAEALGGAWLADRVYSSVPAGALGRRQEVEVSHASGLSNVRRWLAASGRDAGDDALARRLLDAAKAAGHVLSAAELEAACGGGGTGEGRG